MSLDVCGTPPSKKTVRLNLIQNKAFKPDNLHVSTS
jgi:hypothetical protein